MRIFYQGTIQKDAVDEIQKRVANDPLLTIDEVCEQIISEIVLLYRQAGKEKRGE